VKWWTISRARFANNQVDPLNAWPDMLKRPTGGPGSLNDAIQQEYYDIGGV
jgi:hypothetical protein